MAMWEPFTEKTRRVVVRSQEIAHERASSVIDVADFVLAFAGYDDAVGAVVKRCIDFDRLEGDRGTENAGETMTFSAGAKHTIEMAFEQARRFGDNFVGNAHLMLAALEVEPPLPLAAGVDRDEFRDQLIALRNDDAPSGASWVCREGPQGDPLARSVLAALSPGSPEGTRVSVAVEVPGKPARQWVFERAAQRGSG